VAVDGYSEPGDPALPHAYEAAGATWWLEIIHDMRGWPDEMVERINAGPPRIDKEYGPSMRVLRRPVRSTRERAEPPDDLLTHRARKENGMRAIAEEQFGGPIMLMDLPTPKIGADEVLLRVQAAGVNPFDWKVADGALKGKAIPCWW
jgi:hypothetical protein